MSFDKVRRLIQREPVVLGMDRMQPEMRALATALLQRFADGDSAPRATADEGAAMALWGEPAVAFLEWHCNERGVAYALEVLLAALAFHRVMFEWDSAIWALRRGRPAQGLSNLGPRPWVWLRTALAKAKPAERAAAREVASRASRAWLVRAALAFVFPDDDELWTAADEAELRQGDVDDHTVEIFGLLAATRRLNVSHDKVEHAWNVADAIAPRVIVRELGARSVGPLRLMRAFDTLAALAALDEPDAIRVLAEFADEAIRSEWMPRATKSSAQDELARLGPGAIAALAPMFTRLRPRRNLGVHLARALFNELVVIGPAHAEAVARSAPEDAAFILQVLAETGAKLPLDDSWVSPWLTARTKQPAAKPTKPRVALPHEETIRWQPGEHAEIMSNINAPGVYRDDTELEKRCHTEAKKGKAFMLHLGWMSAEAALRTWHAIEPKRWYGQVDDVGNLLARFGLDELDSIIAYVKAKPDTLAALARVESPRVAPLMARGFTLLKKQQDIGRTWLDRFPEAAAIGLLREDGDSKQRAANDKALAHLSLRHKSIVDRVLALAGGGATSTELAAAAVPSLPARRPKLPDFIDAARLPRPIRNDGAAALAGESLVELVQALKATLPENVAALDGIAARYTADSLARFAWSLFRQWLFAKGPPKDKWALYAVGRFPDDDNARALGRLARVWAPRGNPARAQEAIAVLAMMRTQTALVEIYDISRKVQSKALKARAEKVFETVAENLGLAADELAARLVPELSEQDLTFGELRVEIDVNLVPRLVAPDGSVASTPGKDTEDTKRWKELKRICSAVARGQFGRLEQAMAEGYRMSFSHFAEVYLMHSLIRNLSGSLLWGAYRNDGALAFAFAVDRSDPVDIDGTAVELPPDASYGVVHPVELSATDRAAWAKRLPAQPFEQLAREVFTAADATACQQELAKLTNRMVPTGGLLALQRLGWRRGDSPQGGRYYTMQRDGRGWFAELAFAPGIYLGSPTEEPNQALEAIVFRADDRPPASILSDIQRDIVGLLRD